MRIVAKWGVGELRIIGGGGRAQPSPHPRSRRGSSRGRPRRSRRPWSSGASLDGRDAPRTCRSRLGTFRPAPGATFRGETGGACRAHLVLMTRTTLDVTARLARMCGSLTVAMSLLVGLADGSASCSSSSTAGTSCKAAGGTCLLGGAPCATQAASSAQDCNPPPANPGGAFCCLALGDGGVNAGVATSDGSLGEAGIDAASTAGSCVDASPVGTCPDADIQASNYAQTCQQDSDCILVGEGQSCYPCSLAYGPYGAISRGALAQFEADVAKTPGGTGNPVSCASACTPSPTACCRGGQCRADALCSADAGGRD